ncbi:MAG: hypothetical protein R3F19_09105 [Verrucomicrobiales bacterium]
MAQSTDMGKQATLYERIGGSEVLDRMVGTFFQRILADSELLSLFETTTNATLELVQKEFFAAAFEEPAPYERRQRRSGLGIPSHYLPRFQNHFIASLKTHRLSEDDTRTVINRLNHYIEQLAEVR